MGPVTRKRRVKRDVNRVQSDRPHDEGIGRTVALRAPT